MSKPVAIATSFDHGRRCWVAVVLLGDVEQTSADGRDESAAVADAVARFRTARYDRKRG